MPSESTCRPWAARAAITVTLTLLTVVTLSIPLAAQPFPRSALPPQLGPWVPWVLDEVPEHVCPARGETIVCLWPGRLGLTLDDAGGTFTQEAHADRELALALPGGARAWPQDVTLDGRTAPVVASEGVPSIRIGAGRHVVRGRFVWSPLPDSLPVPQATGLVDLSVRGVRVALPAREEDGLLWLRRGGPGATTAESLRLDVFRRIADGIPLFVETKLLLEVSGQAREVTLQGATLADAVPVMASGELPVQLDPEGRLRAQVRAGKHTVTLLARLEGRPSALAAPQGAAPWPATETWVFAADEALRHVQVSGGTPVDPSRTEIPTDWRKLPAFALKGGERLVLTEQVRGEPEAPPDSVRLQRELWLDLSGRGLTVRDTFNGTLARTWRLELAAPGELGRATLDGNDELVTVVGQGDAAGFEARRGQLSAVAESRLPRRGLGLASLPAVGWGVDVERLETRLRLPPGWSLLHATGVDQARGSWVSRWTVMGLFGLIVIALAAGRLLGPDVGLLTFAGVGLAFHEQGAPFWLWLSLLAAGAVARLQPEGRLASAVRWWRGLSLGLLVIVLLFFARSQVRGALWPQAALPSGSDRGFALAFASLGTPSIAGLLGDDELPAPQAQAQPLFVVEPQALEEPAVAHKAPALTRPSVQQAPVAEQRLDQTQIAALSSLGYVANDKQRNEVEPDKDEKAFAFSAGNLAQDPHSTLQTGPGVPTWSWTSASLSWSGPVRRDQRIRLFLLSPGLGLVLACLRLALLFALLARLAGLSLASLRGLVTRASTRAASLALLGATVPLLGQPSPAAAEAETPTGEVAPNPGNVPPPYVLELLKERLTRGAACQPVCIETPRLALGIDGDRLTLRAEVHAAAPSLWVVPGPVTSWTPAEIRLDGQPAAPVIRLDDGFLHVRLAPGVHQIEIVGPLPAQDGLTLQLKDRPRRATATTVGWDVDGLRDDGPPDESIQLLRRRRGGPRAALGGGHYSSWLEVTRALEIGVSWRVSTTVRRVSPAGLPVAVRIPLLAGESVTSGEWQAHDGQVAVSLSRDQTEAVWESTLAPVETLTLAAPAGRQWSEVWRLQCGVVWQCRFEGLPPVRRQNEGRYQPEFRPWPDERLTLRFVRPTGLAGRTLTVDSALLTLQPGVRLETARLDLAVRASREESLLLTVPEGAEVREVRVAGVVRPLRPDGRALRLIVPIGRSFVRVQWQRPRALGFFYTAPSLTLSAPLTNVQSLIELPEGRIPWHVRGPAWGPVVLFWPYLIVWLVAANLLARLPRSPLARGRWVLLAVGLACLPPFVALLLAGLPLALTWRAARPSATPIVFNLIQAALVAWLPFACAGLLSLDLSGRSVLEIAGNGSDATHLRWYVDRAEGVFPTVAVATLPLEAVSVLLLVWLLWLVVSAARGTPWAWRAFGAGGLWAKTTAQTHAKTSFLAGPEAGDANERPVGETPPAPGT